MHVAGQRERRMEPRLPWIPSLRAESRKKDHNSRTSQTAHKGADFRNAGGYWRRHREPSRPGPAEGRSRQCSSVESAHRMAEYLDVLAGRHGQAGHHQVCGDRRTGDCALWRALHVCGKTAHHQRRPMGDARSAADSLLPHSAAVTRLSRSKEHRRSAQHA